MSSVTNQPSYDKVLLSVRVDKENLDKIKAYAKRANTTVSQLVRDFFQHLLLEAERVERDDVEQL